MRHLLLIALVSCALCAWTGCVRSEAEPATSVATTALDGEAVPLAPEVPERGKTVDDPLPITWEDLEIPLEPDSVYESWMLTTRAKAVTDRYVRITGYMYGGVPLRDGVRLFPLLREKECPFGAGGQAHHAIQVNLQGKLRASYTTKPLTIVGYLTVDPFNGANGKTWSLYHLEGMKIQ